MLHPVLAYYRQLLTNRGVGPTVDRAFSTDAGQQLPWSAVVIGICVKAAGGGSIMISHRRAARH